MNIFQEDFWFRSNFSKNPDNVRKILTKVFKSKNEIVFMKIIYTYHAEEQMQERGILKVWVEEAIKWLHLTIKVRERKYIIRRKLNGIGIEFFEKINYISVITVYWITKWK